MATYRTMPKTSFMTSDILYVSFKINGILNSKWFIYLMI